MSKIYALTTLRDVFEQVPADKIELCMREIAEGMAVAKATMELLTAAADAIHPGATALVEWPVTVDWIDDGKGQIGCDFTVNGETMLSLRKKGGDE